jgi:hypothetical protein
MSPEIEHYCACHVRRTWMKWYTMASDEEIERDISLNPPTSLDEELDELVALRDVMERNKRRSHE